MSNNLQNQPADTKLFSLGREIWARNRAVHLASKGSMRAWACRAAAAPLLAILPDQRQARDFLGDAETLRLFADRHVELLPDISFITDDNKLEAEKVQRGDALARFRDKRGILLTTPASLLAPFSSGSDYFHLECGEAVGRDALLSWLEQKGYVRSDLVWSPGQYVSRGSIVDLYSPSDSFPLRFEFFDDELLSIRFFMPETQKSLRTLQHASLQSLLGRAETDLKRFMPSGLHVIYFDPKGLDTTAENASWLWENLERGVKDLVPWRKWDELYDFFAAYPRIRVTQEVGSTQIRLSLRQMPLFKGRFQDVERFCSDYVEKGFRVEVYSEAERTLEWARANGYLATEGILTDGFIDVVEQKIVISDLELAGAAVPRRGLEHRAPSDWGVGLIPGQWVAHDDYGVARYLGPEQVNTMDGEQEYLVLAFAEGQRLLIPVMHFYKISPWSPLPGQEPVADKLKGSSWKKASQKARENAEKAAHELVEIYAQRELTPGYAFAPSREMMTELEESFLYVETTDQLKAIRDVEEDMERPSPMDRLVVGDVGFGKTEVAIRAAGKAVFSGKQVAVMAPTTLLAQQHYETFSARFASMAIRVEVLSRFVPLAKQGQILNNLQEGKVDILIGTHRLLGQDVRFKDLGLVVVDEEHRFGVMHKEHLKKIAPGVDVLMLSATPIPRSLSLSMSGIRDFSVLQTPPQRRLPVITVVRPWSEELLKNAVLREKNRGGQVFFVHNRIHDIQERATMLKRLFPKFRIAVAHGRMPEAVLEKTMMQFSLGSIDILISTTIVESGLDIPMANTLIVDDAQELGLAQMYQLRGRVGRREEQAYAFLFYPEDVKLTVEASERLEAIAQLEELGAGYQLAQRDLQIRGAGDLIGVAQHGNAHKIGFQKYCDLLAEEIAKINGTAKRHVDLEIGFPASIPGSYLPQENQRVTLYRRLLKVDSPQDVVSLYAETVDRFGKMPQTLQFLFNVAFLRTVAPELDITKILLGRDESVLQGIPGGKWTEVKLPPRWMRRLDGFLGPGGFAGTAAIARALQGNMGLHLVE